MDPLANAIRFLSVDAVEKAQSGHPGMPLGMADIATVLWKKFLKHHPSNPHWFNRDRFVVSNGHGAMLLYALLHLTGYALSIEDLQAFRQLHSKTPGHPENRETPGVETTTGPLGQGLANAVGMALIEQVLAKTFNHAPLNLVDHFTYVFVGDGCLMEGISHEAASLAGTLRLGKLIVFYDDNQISIDGPVQKWFSDDTAARFRAYGWQVIEAVDGFDQQAIEEAINLARSDLSRPSLLMCQTIIGYGSMAEGTEKVHGAPLGKTDIAQLRTRFDWPYQPFEIPEDLYQAWSALAQGEQAETAWLSMCQQYQQAYPDQYQEFLRRINGDLPDQFMALSDTFIEQCRKTQKPSATRKASQQCIEFFMQFMPELLGGSADLTASNNTDCVHSEVITADNLGGNYLHYGVREFGMSGIMNGMALHGGVIPFGGTFLVFADYARNAIRLSALMQKREIFVFTHDSIGLGEDGPTHQPIEHLTMLRVTPNMRVWRPADLTETAVAWQQALLRHNGPSCLILSRQNLPALFHAEHSVDGIAKGAYILYEPMAEVQAILIATGSEVSIALEAAQRLADEQYHVRVISMPCAEQFLTQAEDYRNRILPDKIRKRIAIEAGSSAYWYQFVGLDGKVVGIDTFGVSAPAHDAFQAFGFTVEQVVSHIKNMV